MNLRYPGQYYDTETGLFYNWNRYYDPSTGRYGRSDPIGLKGGANTYSSVANAPLNHTDELGLYYGIGCETTLDCECRNPSPKSQANCAAAGIIPKPKLPRIPVPKKPKRPGWVTCICRATANQHCQDGSNQDVKTAFGIGSAKGRSAAERKAKQDAKQNLGQQPKHDSCVCVDSKGKVTRTKGG